MITLTPAAAQQLHAAMEDADTQADGLALRLAAKVDENGAIRSEEHTSELQSH